MAEIIVDIGDNLVETIGCEFKGTIVRCKECKHADVCSQNVAMRETYDIYKDIEFCSYGEREGE